MEQFTFYIERKQTVWVKETHSIDAENKQEAEKLMEKYFAETSDELEKTFVEQEILFDTFTDIDSGDNQGHPVAELYNEDKDLICDNTDF